MFVSVLSDVNFGILKQLVVKLRLSVAAYFEKENLSKQILVWVSTGNLSQLRNPGVGCEFPK